MRKEFIKQLENSGYIHKMLEVDKKRSIETLHFKKEVLETKTLWNGQNIDNWYKDGIGEIDLFNDNLRLKAPARTEFEKELPQYLGYTEITAGLKINNENWEKHNRIICRIKPDCKGFHAPFLTINFKNDGKYKIPDIYNREGFHVVNLENHKWNDCVWEFPDMPRDKVTEISFTLHSHGNEMYGSVDFIFDISDIYVETVKNPDASLGWQGNKETISYSTTGYYKKGEKIAIINDESIKEFKILKCKNNKTVYSGEIKKLENDKGVFGIIDFSDFKKSGRYKIKAGELETFDFKIKENVMEEAVWKVINNVYGQRCGHPVAGRHTYCHGDITATHKGATIPFNGGWHDAGDVSQQTLQTGELAQALFEVAEKTKDNPVLYNRLLEEAKWGMDFVIRTRFGDGYRAMDNSLSRWTNNKKGDVDDQSAVVRYHAFDNFILSGIQAYAGHSLLEDDYDLAWVFIDTAKKDFKLGLDKFEKDGIDTGDIGGHTRNASLSQYYAAASYSASQLYSVTNDDYYAKTAVEYIEKMLECQDVGEAKLPFKGFFYRDSDKKTIVHFNHQSRDYIFVQALEILCKTQSQHENIGVFEKSMSDFGNYLKKTHEYSSPYGMAPAGLHAYDEYKDEAVFDRMHSHTTYNDDKDNYKKQLENGIKLNGKYCIKHFPVWFSFRGNTAVHTATGKAAAIVGNYFNDEKLIEIARDQAYWCVGKNPFGQSLIYGEGANYSQQYAALSGLNVGQMPVGIQTRGNEDEPYWPMAINATYKEVWLSAAGRFLYLISEIY